jgi:hypothetical protein
MTYITANTNDMHATAGELKNAGDRLIDIVNRIQKIEVDSNAYDGQLAEKITPILEGFPGEFQGLSEKLSNNGNKLDQFANDTDAHFANTLSSIMWMMSGVNIDKSEFLSSLNLFSAMRQQTQKALHFIPLTLLPLAINGSGNPMGQNIWNGQTYSYLGNIKNTNRSGGIVITETKIVGFDAAKVRAGIPVSNTTYWRLGYDEKTYSDCTWYAAEAVKYASNDTIDLPNAGWGGANNWVTAAKSSNLVETVDAIPRAGSVYANNGHVAFIEEVIWKEEGGIKEWEIVVSEENAEVGGPPIKDGTPVEDIVGDENNLVKRYTRVISQESGAQFIHFTYSVEK